MAILDKLNMILNEANLRGKSAYKEVKKDLTQKTQLQCMECGAKFKKKIGPRTFEVKCSKCGSYDVEPI